MFDGFKADGCVLLINLSLTLVGSNMFSVCRSDKISFMRRVHRVTSNLSLRSFTITYTLPTLSAPFHSSDIEYERHLTTQN